jgi:hypothetical protein
LDATVMDVPVHANCRTGQPGIAGRRRWGQRRPNHTPRPLPCQLARRA